MKFSYQMEEPLQAALQVAVVAYAWPKFALAHKDGDENQKIDVSGEFSMPVGHYLGVAPEDHILKVVVRLTGAVFPCEGGRHCGPAEELCPMLARQVEEELRGKEFSAEPITLEPVDGLAATAKERFNVKATATVSVVSRKPAVDELPEKIAKLKQQLADAEAQYKRENEHAETTCVQSKERAEQHRVASLGQNQKYYDQTKTELEKQIAQLEQELAVAQKEGVKES
jgi:polyhydroxyalkanoate synthesis regulator phasin